MRLMRTSRDGSSTASSAAQRSAVPGSIVSGYAGANSVIMTVFCEEEQPGDGCERALELVDRAAVAAAFPAEHPPCLHLCHGVLDGGADVNIQAPGLGVAVGDRWLRFGGVCGVAVVAERGFGDDSGL